MAWRGDEEKTYRDPGVTSASPIILICFPSTELFLFPVPRLILLFKKPPMEEEDPLW